MRGSDGVLAFAADCATKGEACRPEWTADVPNASAPAATNGVVYASEMDKSGSVLAFPADCGSQGTTCRPIWTGTTHAWIHTPPVVTADGVYVGAGDGRLNAFKLPAPRDAAPAASSNPIGLVAVVLALVAVGGITVLRRTASRGGGR